MRFIAHSFMLIGLVTALVLSGPKPPALAAPPAASLDQAVRRIKRHSDVRVLSAERVERNGATMYRIKILTPGGRVKYIWERGVNRPPSQGRDRGRGRGRVRGH